MKFILPFFFSLFFVHIGFSQEDIRQILRGQVLYQNTFVPNENVINSTSEMATITNDNGQFAIGVKAGDVLVFTAVNYELMVVTITDEIIQNNRLVVEINEKVTALDEVVVTPEDQERFIQLKNEQFKEVEYELDVTSEVENIALSKSVKGMRDGLNFANIFRALLKSVKGNEDEKARDPLKVSEVLRQVYDDNFFIKDLKLPKESIDTFLVYCDERLPAQSLFKKENEFQLIDFLVTHSKTFLKEINAAE